MSNKEVEAARIINNDQELIEGVYKLGRRYLITTPTWMCTGTLVAVTPMVYVLHDTATVYETGEWGAFFKGNAAREEKHEGSEEMIIDRAGASLNLFASTEKKP